MGTIFVVSPWYLNSIYKEAQKYSFDLQGYGTFKSAISGITKVNACDLLGLAFVGKHLPESKNKGFKDMLDFFQLCDLMASNKKFIIATEVPIAPWLPVFKKYKHIRFIEPSAYDVMSDVVINKQVFGSILLDNSKAYLMGIPQQETPMYDSPRIEYVPLFADALIQCVRKVEILDTTERTLDNDDTYRRFRSDKSFLQYFRAYYVSILTEDLDSVSQICETITAILEEQEANTEVWCSLLALKNFIEGQYIE